MLFSINSIPAIFSFYSQTIFYVVLYGLRRRVFATADNYQYNNVLLTRHDGEIVAIKCILYILCIMYKCLIYYTDDTL